MILTDPYDVELTRYLYNEYVIKRTQHTYGDVSAALEKITGIYKNPHTELPHNLGRISEFCLKELNLPLLSIAAYNAIKGDVGSGFLSIARNLRKDDYAGLNDKDVLKEEKARIEEARKNGDWQRLSDFLAGISVEEIMSKRTNNEIPTGQSGQSEQTESSVNIDLSDLVFPDEVEKPLSPTMEGAVKSVYVNVYERNPEARQLCLSTHGAVCCICGFDAAKTYGEQFEGKIHVHHLIPISEIGTTYVIDGKKDLRPVCPNCHMILHSKKEGCYTIEEVKAMIAG